MNGLDKAVALLATAVLAACGAAPVLPPAVPPILRHANPQPDSPTSAAVEVAPGSTLVFVSGQTPLPQRPDAAEFSAEYWGDTYAQTKSVLQKIDAVLRRAGLGPGDVVKMQVYLVGDPALQGRMDSAGFARAYAEFYGNPAQPLRPSRTTVQIAGLGRPGMLVEIDVIAAARR